MSEPTLSDAERRFLADLEKFSNSYSSRMLAWFLELAPGIALFAYGLATGQTWYLIIGFLSQLYFSIWRMIGQLRGRQMLRSIYLKRLSADEAGKPHDGTQSPSTLVQSK